MNANTLTVTGTGLKDLTAEDITVEDNTVSSVTAAEDGKTATVKLKNPLVVDVATKVTVKDASFDVTYKIEATEVKIAEGQIFDDDTEKQFIQILVNGKAVTAQELITAGYTVEFEAFSTRTGSTPANLFVGPSDSSTTGELDTKELLNGDASKDYYVKVTVTQGSDVMVSPITKVTVKNLDAKADSISDSVLEVTSTQGHKFDLVSSTLAAGDKAKFTELVATIAGDKEYVDLTVNGLDSMFSVKSSDESVISVDKTDYTITAEGPGTATITVTYGGATYTKTLTVKSEARKLKDVKVDKTSVYVGKETGVDDETTFKVQAIDQYGDPFDAGDKGTDELKVQSSNENTAKVALGTSVSTDGKLTYTVTVTGVDTGTADITVRNAADTRLGSSVRVNVIENTTIAKYTLAVDNSISSSDLSKIKTAGGGAPVNKNEVSTDAKIDSGDDKYVKINVKAFNSANQELPKPKATVDYEVTAINASDTDVLESTFGNVSFDGGVTTGNGVYQEDDYLIVKAGSNDGTVTITLTDKNNTNIKQNIRLTVTDDGVNVTKVEFKNIPTVTYATTLDFEDFLTYRDSSKDPRISGLTLSKPSTQAVRLSSTAEGTNMNVDTLYIDLNGDSDYNDGEPIVGYVGMGVTGDVLDENETLITDSVAASTGYTVGAGSDGTVIFRVYNNKEEIVATKAVKVDF